MGLMDIRRRILADAPHIATASGAVANFSTDMASPLEVSAEITPWQEGTGDPSPSNVRAIHGWTGVAGMHTGKNLLDKSALISGEYIKDDGSADQSSAWSRTDYIELPQGKYTASGLSKGGGGGYVAVYNAAKEKLSAVLIVANSITIFTVPANGKYVRLSVRTSDGSDDTAQLELGETATAYAPYTGEQIAVEFPVQGKNLIPQSIVNDSHYFPLTLPAGTQLVFSGIPIGIYGVLRAYDSNKTFKQSEVVRATEGSRSYNAFTLSYDISYVRVEFSGTSFTDVQLEKGTVMTTYEPYTNTVYGGTVDPTTGVLTVNKQHIVVNGNTKLNKGGSSYYGDYGTNTYVTIPSVGFSAAEIMYKPCYADMAQKTNASTWTNPDSNIWKYAINAYTQLHIVFENTVVGITSEMTADERLEAIKTWLTSNPMHFVLPLATPITYQLTPQQITALKGANNVWNDCGDTSVSYWKH